MRDKVDSFLIVVVAICSFIAGATFMAEFGLKPLRKQAVAHGCAYWHVLEDGKTVFRWKEEE